MYRTLIRRMIYQECIVCRDNTTLSGSTLFADDITKKYFSTREIAAQLGLSRMTIHEWCVRFGILAKRNRRNYRMLSLEDVGKLRFIAFLRRLKMTHTEIAREVIVQGWPDPERVAEIIINHHKNLQEV